MNFLSRLLGQEAYKNCKESWNDLSNHLSELDFTKESPIEDLYSWADKLKDWSKSLSEDIVRLKEKLNFITNDRTVEIPYDRDNEILTVEIRDNVFSVTVSDDGENPMLASSTKKTFTMPTDSCKEGIEQKYNKDKHVMVFTFNPCAEEDTVENVVESLETEAVDMAEDTSTENIDDVVEKVLKDRREGMSFRALGRKYGMSDKRAARIVRKNGLE